MGHRERGPRPLPGAVTDLPADAEPDPAAPCLALGRDDAADRAGTTA
ncbi:hypothetical protein [Embleya scabrispora]|nr:hypothetical protein [Embleya scabrispora]MYS86226.1 hypothetical protein [Streptomyces sp. SID5474]